MTKRCGCGRKAEYEVYQDRQPHCKECMEDAIDCTVPVLVRKINLWEVAV